MKYDPEKHHRRSVRLQGYDYAQTGAYFVTICTQNRECLFGEILDGSVQLNAAGQMIEIWWLKLNKKFQTVATDHYIVMPNHFHGIVGATPRGRPESNGQSHEGQPHGVAPTVGDIVNWYKTMTTNEYIRCVKKFGWSPFPGRLWQRNYYEHIIRDDDDLNRIREYIIYNPAKWDEDDDNPINW